MRDAMYFASHCGIVLNEAAEERVLAQKHQAIDHHLGAKVRIARIENGISQTVLGDQLGISFQQVQKYELGKDRISASQLLSIARTLDREVSFFFEDLHEGDRDGADATPLEAPAGRMARTTTAYDIKIIRLLHSIDDERVKMRLFGLMEAIVETRNDAGRAKNRSLAEAEIEPLPLA